jgi:hypothetical protein
MKGVDRLLDDAVLLESVCQAQWRRHLHSRTLGRLQTLLAPQLDHVSSSEEILLTTTSQHVFVRTRNAQPRNRPIFSTFR